MNAHKLVAGVATVFPGESRQTKTTANINLTYCWQHVLACNDPKNSWQHELLATIIFKGTGT